MYFSAKIPDSEVRVQALLVYLISFELRDNELHHRNPLSFGLTKIFALYRRFPSHGPPFSAAFFGTGGEIDSLQGNRNDLLVCSVPRPPLSLFCLRAGQRVPRKWSHINP